MPICNTNEFLNSSLDNKKIMCIDIGKKRYGVALSDPFNKFSLAHKTLRSTEKKIHEQLIDIIKNYNINLIIVGLPLNEDLSLNKQCQSIVDKTKDLDEKFIVCNKVMQIIFWDESYTSLTAEDKIKSKLKRKKTEIDHFAASIILQDFLDFFNKK